MSQVISIIKEGFGNKVFMFANIVYFYRELQKRYPKFKNLYIAVAKSSHYEIPFSELFPNINSSDDIHLIDFETFAKMIKDMDFVTVEQGQLSSNDFNTKSNIYFKANYEFSIVPFNSYYKELEMLLTLNPKLIDLEYNYNFKNDILLHLRYGDKITSKNHFVLSPSYYFDALEKLSEIIKPKMGSKVYVFTDSPQIYNEVYKSEFEKFSNLDFVLTSEPYWNLYYLCQKFKNIILSESTLTYAGLQFNQNTSQNIITFDYINNPFYSLNKRIGFYPNKSRKIFKYKKYKLSKNPLNRKEYKVLSKMKYILK